MSDNEFERIQPVSLDGSAPPANHSSGNPAIPESREARPLNPATLAIALLVVIAALVIFVLPGLVSAPPETDASAQPAPSAAAPAVASPARAPEPTSPWENAQKERARAAAKAALDALLVLQDELQQRGVEIWAAEEFAAVTALARQGDEAYRSEGFDAAQAAWQQASQQLEALKQGLPARLAARIAEGEAAIAAADSAAAQRAFDAALAIEPGNADAEAGLALAGRIDRLNELLVAGRSADAAGNTDDARARYREAVALDAQWKPAQAALAELEARMASAKAANHVSAGYAALAASRLDEARRQFNAAIALGAGAAAREGLQQAEFQSSQSRISTLLAKLRSEEQAENWQQALDASEAALKVDPELAAARDARERARARVALDAAMAKIARQPETLLTEAARTSADKLIAAARSVSNPGPRLRAQIATAESRLAEMRTKVAVNLVSDGKTDVTIFRIGGLGQFTEHRIELLPGDYVAAGTRDGYRDVRVSFSVRPGSPPPPVRVLCGQQI